jgi:putative membrane protein
MATGEKEERLLILCVDRDDDIGVKTDEKTPILGRERNLEAAVSLALRDPEEPDANAMFEALRVYDKLNKQGQPHEKFQIATISGSQILGVEADRKLVRELNSTLEVFPANNVILVTDGYADEAVLPLVESRVPVTSVRRIVVKHSESIEETAALFSKYLKMLTNDPRYSRVALGVPGLMLIILAIMYLGGWIYYTWIAFLIVLGVILFVKGFGVDRATIYFVRWIREYEPPPLPVQIAGFAVAAGVISAVVGVYLGVNEVAAYYSSLSTPVTNLGELLSLLPRFLGEFIGQGINLIVIGVCVVLSGRAIRWYVDRDVRLLRTLVFIAVIAWSSQIFGRVSVILIDPTVKGVELVFMIFIGILLAIAASLIALVVNMKYGSFFKRQKEVEEFEQS